MNDKVGESTF